MSSDSSQESLDSSLHSDMGNEASSVMTCKFILLEEKVDDLDACLATLRLIKEDKKFLDKAEGCLQNNHGKKRLLRRKDIYGRKPSSL